MGKSYKDVKEHQDFFAYKIIDDNTESLVKVQIGNQFYSPIELSSFILAELKKRAEHILKTPVTKAVITVPAYFNDAQRQATRDAGKLAGLDVLRIINEPTAASLAYGLGMNPTEEKTIAVYDLGGGTFDISILKISNGIFEVLSTNGDTYLGGDDLDRAIIEYWLKSWKVNDANNHKQLQQELRLAAEQAKITLSNADIFETEFAGEKISITKEVFENLIQPIVKRTMDCCSNAMRDAGLQVSDIHTVSTKAGRQYTTQKDGQTGMVISVYQGERDLVKDNRKLGEFTLTGIPNMPAGLPKVDVSFLINADGILQVSAKELRSGVSQTIDIKPQYGLTDEEVEQRLLDSITHAKDDIASRALVEARTEAEQILSVTEKFLTKNASILTKEEITLSATAMQALQLAITMEDKNLIQAKTEELNEVTRPFAERAMDEAISGALKGKGIMD